MFPSDRYQPNDPFPEWSDGPSSSSDSDTLERVVHIDIANQKYKPVTASSFMFSDPAEAQSMLDERLNKNRLEERDVYSDPFNNIAHGNVNYTKEEEEEKKKKKKKKKKRRNHNKKTRHHYDSSSDSSTSSASMSSDSSSSSWTSAGTSSGTPSSDTD